MPLIGFTGAPFTLASYIIEGGSSKNYEHAKAMMFSEPGTWHKLMDHLTGVIIDYLNAQIDTGVQAVQVFDSWVGALSTSDYREFVLPHQKNVIAGIKKSVPLIHFAHGATHLLEMVPTGPAQTASGGLAKKNGGSRPDSPISRACSR